MISAHTDEYVPEDLSPHPAWVRLEEQRKWYSSESGRNKRYYQRIKVVQIVLASAIPLIALMQFPWGSWATALAGSVIAVLESVQQLKQFPQLSIEYRSTAERLKRNKYLFLAEAGPYRNLDIKTRLSLLAERVEEVLSTEHERWLSSTQQTSSKKYEDKKSVPIQEKTTI